MLRAIIVNLTFGLAEIYSLHRINCDACAST